MKSSDFLLPAAGFVIAIGCALAPRPDMPVPYYGIDPISGLCLQGPLSGICSGGVTVRCSVIVNGSSVPGFDNKVGTSCTTPVFRPSSMEPPDTLSLSY